MSEEIKKDAEVKLPNNFIHQQIIEDLAAGKNGNRVHTRFPPNLTTICILATPNPNHLNFGTAQKFGGLTNLRFDDTNPTKEDTEYVDSIMEDVKWLGFDWEDPALLCLRLL